VTRLVLALPGSEALGQALGALASIPCGVVESRRFPDDETYLRIDADCADASVVIAGTLDRPDPKLLPLAFLTAAARAQGATRVGLVAPYLAYMRQDVQFRPGEAVTSRTFAALVSNAVDWLVTVDPHLHRYRALDEIYGVPSRAVHAAPALAAWIAAHVDQPLVVGPDEESAQWVKDVADRAGAPCVVMRKTRRSDRVVEITAPDVSRWRACTPVVVDDVVSSGQTMVETVRRLVAAAMRPPVCLAVHALFTSAAEQALQGAGATGIVATNTIAHPRGIIDVLPLVAPAVVELASVASPSAP
jgi:ribose-phosphate pyrophosphokinase